MPDLSFAAAAAWVRLNEPEAPGLGSQPPTGVEQSPAVEKALARLGDALSPPGDVAHDPLPALCTEQAVDELRQIMAQLGAVRVARLVGWLVKDGPAGAAALVGPLLDAEGHAASYIRTCLSEATRPTLLSRIYDPARLAALLVASRVIAETREAA